MQGSFAALRMTVGRLGSCRAALDWADGDICPYIEQRRRRAEICCVPGTCVLSLRSSGQAQLEYSVPSGLGWDGSRSVSFILNPAILRMDWCNPTLVAKNATRMGHPIPIRLREFLDRPVIGTRDKGSFDFSTRFASESSTFAQDDSGESRGCRAALDRTAEAAVPT